ncbi:MAG TPA: DUF2239 family protein [Bryobacteraceae bacterium]|nr:DUF2239 family protein [Bryobacteraceae bacterium]
MVQSQATTYTAFLDNALVATGPLETTLPAVKARFDHNPGDLVLIFEDQTGRQVDFDLRGSLPEVLARAVPSTGTATRSGPGRPKLGVVSREISLLPRHWEWLEEQPNGASAALRRLVDEARNRNPAGQRARLATEAAGRFLSATAGNLPGYEEATRALYAGNRPLFEDRIRDWPVDLRAYVLSRLDAALQPGE